MTSIAAYSALPRMGDGIGLHRMLDLCREPMAGDWFARLDAIKVTGSNGKGSVSALAASVLGHAGVEVGLYTSPHLFDFRERITVGREPISKQDLDDAAAWFERRHRRYRRRFPDDRVGSFEAVTASALYHFANVCPGALVVEAGIGGRYDSTRIFPGRLSGLVSLDLEHSALLGRSLEEIAYDKADLAGEGTTLVTGGLPSEVARRLDAYGRLRHLEVVRAGETCRVLRATPTVEGTRLDFDFEGRRWEDLHLALLGRHQVANAQVAVVLAARWLRRHRPRADLEEAVRRGLAGARWPCRLEKVRSAPDVFLDAGHTPGAVEAVAEAAREILHGRRILLVTGVSYDKEVAAVVSRLTPVADRAIATRAHHKGAPAAAVADAIRTAAPALPCEVRPTIGDALGEATEIASHDGSAVLVAGGLFLAAEAAAVLRGKDPRDLEFL